MMLMEIVPLSPNTYLERKRGGRALRAQRLLVLQIRALGDEADAQRRVGTAHLEHANGEKVAEIAGAHVADLHLGGK